MSACETLLRKLLSRFMDFDGGPHWTEADYDLVEKCWAHFRNADRGETATPKPTPPPSSPLKFGSLKEMGEHIARLADALEQGKEIERFDTLSERWVLAGVGDTRSRAHLKPELFRLKPAPAKPREWWGLWFSGSVCELRATEAEAKKQQSHYTCPPTLKRLIEWPEGAELPELPGGG